MNNPIFKSSNARALPGGGGMLKFRVDRRKTLREKFQLQFRVVTRYMGSRMKDQKQVGIRDHRCGIWVTTPGIRISGVFHWTKDQAFWINKILRDKGSKFSSRLEPGIKNLGKITGSAMKKYTSLRPCTVTVAERGLFFRSIPSNSGTNFSRNKMLFVCPNMLARTKPKEREAPDPGLISIKFCEYN